MSSIEPAGIITVSGRIAAALEERSRGMLVADVRIGLGYTAVQLEDGSTGVAMTFREDASDGCSVFNGPLPLAGRAASDLLPMIFSDYPIEAAVGLACANAMLNRPDREYRDGGVLEHIDLRPQDSVVMVGHFGPMVEPVRQRVRSLAIFERIKEPDGHLRPADGAKDALEECEVALITATSIINRTMDDLLGACRNCRVTAVLGASTPMLPDAFSGTHASLLSGVVVTDPEAVLRIVSEGGGMRIFKSYVRKVNLSLTGLQ